MPYALTWVNAFLLVVLIAAIGVSVSALIREPGTAGPQTIANAFADPRVSAALNGSLATNQVVAANTAKLSNLGSVRVATTGSVNVSDPPASVDGVTLAVGDKVLRKSETNLLDNGIYTVGDGVWTFDEESLNVYGGLVAVQAGTVNGGQTFVLFSAEPGNARATRNVTVRSVLAQPFGPAPNANVVLARDANGDFEWTSNLNVGVLNTGDLQAGSFQVTGTTAINGNVVSSSSLTVDGLLAAPAGLVFPSPGTTTVSSGPFTIGNDESGNVFFVNTTAAPFTVNLPAAPVANTYLRIYKNVITNTNGFTLNGNGKTIQGQLLRPSVVPQSLVVAPQSSLLPNLNTDNRYQNIELYYDENQDVWNIIGTAMNFTVP